MNSTTLIEFVVDMLLAFPLVLLWLTVVSLSCASSCASVRSAVAFDTIYVGQAQVGVSGLTYWSASDDRRNPILRLWKADHIDSVRVSRMEVLAWRAAHQ